MFSRFIPRLDGEMVPYNKELTRSNAEHPYHCSIECVDQSQLARQCPPGHARTRNAVGALCSTGVAAIAPRDVHGAHFRRQTIRA